MPQLFKTKDGSDSLFSEQFGVSYHSKYGAIQETQHVFINAALRLKALHKRQISILDIGFGTGLNAYMTLLEAQKRYLDIQYAAIEAFPIDCQQANQLNYNAILEADKSQAQFMQLHEALWEVPIAIQDNFSIIKHKMKFEMVSFIDTFDIIYYDAFAPNAQPELWGEEIFTKMYRALKWEGILVTYCAKGIVKRTLKSIGFEVESLKGPPGKREMTRAIKVEPEN